MSTFIRDDLMYVGRDVKSNVYKWVGAGLGKHNPVISNLILIRLLYEC